MTPADYRRLADALATLSELVGKMANEQNQTSRVKTEYVNKTEAGRMLGCSAATIRNRIAEGLLKEYPAGMKVSELEAYARGETAKPAKDYRIESPRTRAGRSNV